MPLGMERRLIPSSSISASSFLNKWLLSWSPDLARLHQEGRANAWRPKVSVHPSYYLSTYLRVCLSILNHCMLFLERVKVNFLSTLRVFYKPIVRVFPQSCLSVKVSRSLHCLTLCTVFNLSLFYFLFELHREPSAVSQVDLRVRVIKSAALFHMEFCSA